MTTGTRDNRGRFTRTLNGAERDAEACRLRACGYSYGDIAKRLGYGNKSNAHRAVMTVLASTVRDGADELRELALLELDVMAREARAVLHREHVLVSHGRVIRRDGEPIPDDGPAAASDRPLTADFRAAEPAARPGRPGAHPGRDDHVGRHRIRDRTPGARVGGLRW